MLRYLLIIPLLLTAFFSQADCFERAGRDYHIDPDLLRAIAWVESKGNINALGKKPTQGIGLGYMQIDSHNFDHLAQFSITPELLMHDGCMNIYTGAYYLATAFKRWGANWDAVGAYNAGFKKTDEQARRRQIYVRKVYPVYLAYKKDRRSFLSQE